MMNNDSVTKSIELLELLRTRKTIRNFSRKPIPMDVVVNCIKIAAAAPSGANKQPWHFVVVTDEELKARIRSSSELVEHEFYSQKISDEWKSDLEPLNLSIEKPFLEDAPCLICIFAKKYETDKDGKHKKLYYVNESVGISVGFLIQSLHLCGLSCVSYTPAPMTFLNNILHKPKYFKPFMILAVGYPNDNIEHTHKPKKPIDDVLDFI